MPVEGPGTMMSKDRVPSQKTRVVVAICTYRRNEPLAHLLEVLKACALEVREVASVGVAVIDDTAAGEAREVAEAYKDQFEAGLTYRIAGHQNISIARNLAIETAAPLSDWTAMIDDDCEPTPRWLLSLLEVQGRTSADAVTGVMIRRVPPGSPKWLASEPFLTLGAGEFEDAQVMSTAFTNNSIVSSAWLIAHPDLRFREDLGVLGGEDMQFFQAARAEGLNIHFSEAGFVYENEPPSRATLSYQLKRFYWHGNSTYVTLVAQGKRPSRAFLHGVANLVRSFWRPLLRVRRGQTPQLRYAAASVLSSLGIMAGLVGVRVNHH